MKSESSILFLQNGDFEEAFTRFAEGGSETYRDQKASVDFVASLAPNATVTTFAFGTNNYHSRLADNLWAAGGNLETFGVKHASRLLDRTEATHIILRTPNLEILREAARRRIHVLPSFADIFSQGSLTNQYRNWRLQRALLQCQAPCFSNHSLNASRSMVEALGLPQAKVIPWDWTRVPVAKEAKFQVADKDFPTAFFAGMLSEEKGVGDCLDALSILRAENIKLSMSFAGPGDLPKWRARADRLGISEQVHFLGMIPNADVRTEMRRHDFVIVPSRHSYAEGLPNTIYEGLASRSALIISDHPAFAGRLLQDEECLVFSAGNPSELATCLKRSISDPDLYRRLSENGAFAHDKLYVGVEWTSLVTAFLNDPTDRQGWVMPYSLAKMGKL